MITGGGRLHTGWAQAGRSARRLAEPLGRVSGGEAGDAMVSAQPTLERVRRTDAIPALGRGAALEGVRGAGKALNLHTG